MKTLKTLAAALTATVCFSNYVLAADMYHDQSLKDAPAPEPVASWSGFYLGAGGGGGVAEYDGDIAGAFTPLIALELFGDSFDTGTTFGFGTVQLGYDRQLSKDFVVGLFADYDFHSGSSDTNSSVLDIDVLLPISLLSTVTDVEIDNSWTVGGRLGFLVTPATMLYGLAGWTHTSVSIDGVFTAADILGLGAGVAFSEEEDIDSLTVGAGVETLLRDNLSLKVEYRYTDLDAFGASSPITTLEFASVNFDTDIHTVRAVLTWRPGY